MGKRLFTVTAVLLLLSSFVAASNIGITYKGNDYIITTSISMTPNDADLYYGYYDAFVAVMEGRQLYEMQLLISKMTFQNIEGGRSSVEQKENYIRAFTDFMDRYSYGSAGDFKDVYPLYDQFMNLPVSYRNAQIISEFGAYRFYLRNL